MPKFDWVSTASINFSVLRAVGLWPYGEESYKINLYTLYAVFNAVVLIGLHNFTQIINIFYVYSDLTALTATCFILTTNMLAIAKMWFFARNVNDMKDLLRTLNGEEFQPKSEEQIKLVLPLLRRWRMSYIVYSGYVSFNMSLWVFGPLSNGGHQLIMPAWYPYDIQSSPNYELTYIYQAICFTYLTTANVNVDTITYALFMYICTQCDILCDDLSNLSGKKEEFDEKLVKCVKHHKTILSFAKKTNSLFNMIILGQFATSTMALALTMFQLSLVRNFDAGAVVGVFYMVGLSMQLFLYCWFGNEVETKSSNIPYAAYNSQWFDISAQVRNSLLILGQRCQRPLKITAIDLFDLSLKTFVTILRSAWSYFAVLHSVNNV